MVARDQSLALIVERLVTNLHARMEMVTSLSDLLGLFRHHGAYRIYAKMLSPNDNSKNQIYLGGGFAALNIIPHGDIYIDSASRAGSKRDRPKARVKFFWVDGGGKYEAPDVNLILYPDYPEVRMSGFLRGCESAPSNLMTRRDAGRVLVLGVTREGHVLGWAGSVDTPVAAEIRGRSWPSVGVFLELPIGPAGQSDPRSELISRLQDVHRGQWIQSQKLNGMGVKLPYAARNGGGYTLEAELGIRPNGYSEPDFLGWEVKQYGVGDFIRYAPKSAVTLFTPEPTGGLYKSEGPGWFVERYGYPDKSGKPDRMNFGGVYAVGKLAHPDTRLRMTIRGFDAATGKIEDIEGGLALIENDEEEAAAIWSFEGLMAHWNRKHAQAAYVPSLYRSPPPEYAYGAKILLCEETDFIRFLRSFASGKVYYDPAIKIAPDPAGRLKLHRRSQFRVLHSNLTALYGRSAIENLEQVGANQAH
ncbi:MvaI/BcnI family restriction endonuclease [Brevundimonas sp.]|uniref:MvaI/BcnI family restriction endonuclease n=1 Tax=Brevundimonas sp. TaxID=1871086 RepID=UPI0035123002